MTIEQKLQCLAADPFREAYFCFLIRDDCGNLRPSPQYVLPQFIEYDDDELHQLAEKAAKQLTKRPEQTFLQMAISIGARDYRKLAVAFIKFVNFNSGLFTVDPLPEKEQSAAVEKKVKRKKL